MHHGGERDPVRYAQLGERVPESGVSRCGQMYGRLATVAFVSPSTTRWDGDDDDHIEQLLAEDGSKATVTAKPGTPARTTLTGKSRTCAAAELLNRYADAGACRQSTRALGISVL